MGIQIGPHRIEVENDILFAYVSHRLQLEELKQIHDLCEKAHARFGSAYLVTVMGPGYELPPECRKHAAEWGRDHDLYNLVVGASFAIRTLINLLSRASKLVGARNPGVDFVTTIDEARQRIAEHKERVANSQENLKNL